MDTSSKTMTTSTSSPVKNLPPTNGPTDSSKQSPLPVSTSSMSSSTLPAPTVNTTSNNSSAAMSALKSAMVMGPTEKAGDVKPAIPPRQNSLQDSNPSTATSTCNPQPQQVQKPTETKLPGGFKVLHGMSPPGVTPTSPSTTTITTAEFSPAKPATTTAAPAFVTTSEPAKNAVTGTATVNSRTITVPAPKQVEPPKQAPTPTLTKQSSKEGGVTQKINNILAGIDSLRNETIQNNTVPVSQSYQIAPGALQNVSANSAGIAISIPALAKPGEAVKNAGGNATTSSVAKDDVKISSALPVVKPPRTTTAPIDVSVAGSVRASSSIESSESCTASTEAEVKNSGNKSSSSVSTGSNSDKTKIEAPAAVAVATTAHDSRVSESQAPPSKSLLPKTCPRSGGNSNSRVLSASQSSSQEERQHLKSTTATPAAKSKSSTEFPRRKFHNVTSKVDSGLKSPRSASAASSEAPSARAHKRPTTATTTRKFRRPFTSGNIREMGDDQPTQPGSGDAGKATLKDQFTAFAKFGDATSDGKQISLTNSDKWMKQAHVIDGKKITTTDTSILFKKLFKTAKKVGFDEFKKYVEDLATGKKMEPKDLLEKLTNCGHPGLSHATKAAHVSVVDRLTDTSKYTGSHKERFDATGKGRGLDGRRDVKDASGYTAAFKEKLAAEKNGQVAPASPGK